MRRTRWAFAPLLALSCSAACIRGGAPEELLDGGDAGDVDAAVGADAALTDGPSSDAAPPTDASEDDAGLLDAGAEGDAGRLDAGGPPLIDAGVDDAGLPDAGPPFPPLDGGVDAGTFDAGVISPDAGALLDAGVADAGITATCQFGVSSPVVRIFPLVADSTDDLHLEIRATDTCVDSYTIIWARNSLIQTGLEQQLMIPAIQTTRGDVWTALVTAYDAEGHESVPVTATRTVANAPPQASVTLPTTVTQDNPLTVQVYAADPDGDEVSYTVRWTRDGVPFAAGNDLLTVPASQLRAGQEWRVSVTPDDGALAGSSATAATSVQNRPPVVTQIQVTPADASAESTLTVSGVAIDPDGAAVSVTWRWEVDGVVVPGAISETLAAGHARRGQTVVAYATAASQGQSAGPFASNALQIRNARPQVIGLRLLPNNFTTSDDIRCDAAERYDADGDTVELRYEWVRNPGTEDLALPYTDAELPAGLVQRGQTVSCRATPFDGVAEGTPATVSGEVRNSPPAIPRDPPGSVRVLPENPTSADELSCRAYNVFNAEDDLLTYTTIWTRRVNGIVANTYEGETLAPGTVRGGDEVVCIMTPSDGFSTGLAVASPRVIVANAPPTVESVTISPAAPSALDELSCDPAGVADSDLDEVSFAYAWYPAGNSTTPISTSQKLPPETLARDAQVYCVVTPSDGKASGTPKAAAAVTFVNSLPTIQRVQLGPATATLETELTCEAVGLADLDNEVAPESADPLVTDVRWWVDGTEVGATLPAAQKRKGRSVECVLTPRDSLAAGAPVRSNTLVLRDSPGRMCGADDDPPCAAPNAPTSITPAAPRSHETLTCVPGSVIDPDPEDEPVRHEYRWLRSDGVPLSTLATLTPDLHARGDQVRCEATAYFADANAPGVTASSAWVTLGNGKPRVVSAEVTPVAPNARSTLSVEPIAQRIQTQDPDEDATTVTLAWYLRKNGSDTLLGTGASVSPPLSPTAPRYQKGDQVVLRVLANDGELNSDPYERVIVIGNDAPQPVDARLYATTEGCWVEPGSGSLPSSCNPVRHADDLRCEPVANAPATDLDGDPVTYRVEWSSDGVNFSSGAESATPDAYLTENLSGDTLYRHAPALGARSHCRIVAVDDDALNPLAATGQALDVDWLDGPWIVTVNTTNDTPLSTAGGTVLTCKDASGNCSLRAAVTLSRSISRATDPLGVTIRLTPGATYTLATSLEATSPLELVGDENQPPTLRPEPGGFRVRAASADTGWKVSMSDLKFGCSTGRLSEVLTVEANVGLRLDNVEMTDCQKPVVVNAGELEVYGLVIEGPAGLYSAIDLNTDSSAYLADLEIRNRGKPTPGNNELCRTGVQVCSAIDLLQTTTVQLVRPILENNYATYGAHIWFQATTQAQTLRIEEGTLDRGTTVQTGGAIYIGGGGTLEIIDSTLTRNSASSGGAIYGNSSSVAVVVSLDGTVLQRNVARSGNGGAIYLSGPGTPQGELRLSSTHIGAFATESCGSPTWTIKPCDEPVMTESPGNCAMGVSNGQGGGMWLQRILVSVPTDQDGMPYNSGVRCNRVRVGNAAPSAGAYFSTFSTSDPWATIPEGLWISENYSTTATVINVNNTTQLCGNNYVEADEICDDGNRVDGDGCNNSCQ